MTEALRQLEADLRRIQDDMDKILRRLPMEEKAKQRYQELNDEWKRFESNAKSFIWVNS